MNRDATDTRQAADELDEWVSGQMHDPAFARAWERVTARVNAAVPRPLCIDGRAYRRRQQARRKRGR